MSKANNLTDFLKDIADGIREKKGTTDKINPQDFRKEIDNLSGSFSIDDLLSKKISGTITLPSSIGIKPSGIQQNAWDTYPDMHGVYPYLFFACSGINKAINESTAPFRIGDHSFRVTGVSEFDFKNVTYIGSHAFHDCGQLKDLLNMDSVVEICDGAFISCRSLQEKLILPVSLQRIGVNIIGYAGVKKIIFQSKPTKISSSAFNRSELTDIYVPWDRGDVSGAPWGATGANIHYACTVKQFTLKKMDGTIVTFDFIEGMTWAEWVRSPFNKTNCGYQHNLAVIDGVNTTDEEWATNGIVTTSDLIFDDKPMPHAYAILESFGDIFSDIIRVQQYTECIVSGDW